MSRITLRNLTKTFPPNVHAVCDVDLELAAGEIAVVVGPSGSGKSTLLRMIAGLESPTAGEVWIGDRNVTRDAPSERGVGMVFQESALYPHLSVRANLAFGLKKRKVTPEEITRRVEATASALGVGELLDRKPSQISGGEAQRVALGRAMVQQPGVLLLDEPLSNLDASLRDSLRQQIRDLHQLSKTTMLHVTHDQAEAMALADRLVVMHQGKVQQVAPPREVYQRPANRFVASFFGSPAMNFFEGSVQDELFGIGETIRWPLAGVADGPLVLGVRPEDMVPCPQGEPVFARGVVERVEYLGRETFATFDLGASVSCVTLWPDEISIGETALLTLRSGGTLHRFLADDSGQRIE